MLLNLTDQGDDPRGGPLDELEAAYQRALAAVEAVEATLPDELSPVPDDEPGAGASGGDPAAALAETSEADGRPQQLPAAGRSEQPDEQPDESAACPVVSRSGGAGISPRQVIEAALFVGGEPLTARKLCWLLGGEADHAFVDRAIESLNERYAAQGRPYLIRLAEGGYRIAVRPEFEGVRSRVFGYGPKEVRLSQEAVETLSLVAYRQPLSRRDVEHALERPAGSVLNQLLRRELIAIERPEGAGGEVVYRTTPRFLELFGLGGLHELPQPDDLSFK